MLRTFRSQLTVAFGAGVLVLAAALSLGIGSVTSRTLLRDQSDTLQTQARSVAVMLGEGLFERLREVEQLSRAPAETGLSGWQDALERVQQSRPHFSWIGLANVDGLVTAASRGMLVGASVAERPWFKHAVAGPYVGDVHAAKLLAKMLPPSVSGEPVRFIDFAAPVRDANGQVRAVLGVHANWDWAHDVVASLHSPLARENGVLVFIYDRNGELIHRPLDTPAARPPALQSQPRGRASILRWDDGREYLTAVAALPADRSATDMGWTVVARQPVAQATAAAREARDAMLAIGGAGALLCALVGWVVAGRLATPLSRIADAAKDVQTGRLDTEIPALAGSREVRRLSSALRDMTAALTERGRALAEANSTLEQRVAERTTELSRTAEALRRANGELEKLASRDPLTGLSNRRTLDDALAAEIGRHRRSGAPLSIVLADIDRFKQINDSHGHGAGDEVLRRVADTLLRGCRTTDIVGRLGGEEFLIVMPETPLEGARIACEKLRARVAALQDPLPVTVSFGLVAPAQYFFSPQDALDAADQAMYAAKAQGRNRVCVYDGQTPDMLPVPGGEAEAPAVPTLPPITEAG